MLVLIPIIVLFFLIFFYLDNQNDLSSNIEGNFFVSKKVSNGIIFKWNGKKIFLKTYDAFKVDDLVKIKSSNLNKITDYSKFNLYLKSEGVNYYINDNSEIKLIGMRLSTKRIISDYLIEGDAYYSRYVPLILLGLRYPKNEVIINKISNINIQHLFTISGFHINIILFIIEKILNRFNIKNKYIYFFSSLLIIPYIVIINFPIAATRALLFGLLVSLNKYFWKNKFNKLNLLSITMLIFFIYNPYITYSMSFIFTYIMTFSIVLLSTSLNKKHTKLKFIIFTWVFSLIISAIASKSINLISFFSNLFFAPIVSFTYVLTFLFFWLKPAMDNYFFLFDVLINMWQYLKINININLSNETIILITTLLFLLLLIIIEKPKYSIDQQKINKIFNNYH